MNKFFGLILVMLLTTGAVHAQPYDNWVSSDGTVWKSANDEYCWRNSAWAPVMAHPNCAGALVAPRKIESAVPVVCCQKSADVPAVSAQSVAVAQPPQVLPPALTFAAAALFDTNSAVLKSEGVAQLDVLVAQIKSVNWQALLAVGHADARGSSELNQALSLRRADAVKAYLVSQGLSAQQIKTDGKGATMPVADNSTADGRAKNRRVEVEVTGTAKK